MITTINMSNNEDELERYSGMDDLKQFYQQFGCDGIEYLRVPGGVEIPKEMVQGVHLSSFQNWMDLWLGDERRLVEEFGNLEVAAQFYGGTKPQDLIAKFQKELDFAQESGAKYVVFHVSEVKIKEAFTYDFAYTSQEVVKEAITLINQLLDGKKYTFDFLMENLWWPGLNFTEPDMAQMLLEGVHYERKGFMLDTGHLLNTNLELQTQVEAVAYIHQILDNNKEICPWIKGVHLHQSLSGAFVKAALGDPPALMSDYWERWCQVFQHIFQVDKHQPFTEKGVKTLIQRMAPKYLTYELITRSRQEHQEYLKAQTEALS